MKNKKIIIIIAIISLLGILFLTTGRARTDVYLKDFELSSDGKTMTLKIGVTSSSGYVRKIKRTSGSMNYYFTFYSTFGINSKLGAKDTFEIEIDSNVDAIYFYTGAKGYKQVLEKNSNDEWIKATDIGKITEVENVSTEIFDISPTGATIVITDKNKEPYTYGEWYKIEKLENNKWIELEPLIDDYGFISIGYLVDENNQVKFVIDWEKLYGKLSNGSYRILKEVNHNYIYIPFNIATTS